MADTATDPAVNAAMAAKLTAEAAFFNAQAQERGYLAEQAKMELDLSQKAKKINDATNTENRVYDFVGGVDERSCEAAMKTLSQWRRMDPKAAITVRFSSPGGSVIDGFALFDYIEDVRRSGIKVTTVAYGYAASMAAILMQSGDVRVMAMHTCSSTK